jgi:superfamily I DNA/RNA helicase
VKPLQQNRSSPSRYRKNAAVAAALARVAQTVELDAVRDAMVAMEMTPGAKPFRRELWGELGRAIAEFARGEYSTVRAAAWAARNRARFGARRLDQRLVSRTLLIKGLEFDNVLVLNADEFENPKHPGEGAKNFYVAMTRAARVLVVLSDDSHVRFTKPTM